MTFGVVGVVAFAGFGGNEEFVEVEIESEVMVIGKGEGECGTDTQICGEKCGIFAVVVLRFGTDVRDVPSPRPLTFVASDDGVGGEISGDVGGKG